jgi:hypothetical protein
MSRAVATLSSSASKALPLVDCIRSGVAVPRMIVEFVEGFPP